MRRRYSCLPSQDSNMWFTSVFPPVMMLLVPCLVFVLPGIFSCATFTVVGNELLKNSELLDRKTCAECYQRKSAHSPLFGT